MRLVAALGGIVLILDQAVKWLALRSLGPGVPVNVIDGFFSLTRFLQQGLKANDEAAEFVTDGPFAPTMPKATAGAGGNSTHCSAPARQDAVRGVMLPLERSDEMTKMP